MGGGISVSGRIAAFIREQILDGQLKPGDRLPSERELAESLRVGRSAVREALQTLRAQGYVADGRGRNGTVVSSLADSRIGQPLGRLLTSGVAQVVDLFELRLGLEVQAASLAAWRRLPQDVAALEEIVAAMRQRNQPDPELDAAFHGGIAQAAHNVFYVHVTTELVGLLHTFMPAFLEVLDNPVSTQKMLDQHDAILFSIVSRDAEGARSAMTDHLEWVAREICRIESQAAGSVRTPLDGSLGHLRHVKAAARSS
jgi:GntR family transcriptional regulator, transcriptional repressor for pyruvate dehydrogenase complex